VGERWGNDRGDFLKEVPPDPFKNFQNVMDVFDDLVEHLTMIAISLVRRAKENDGERWGTTGGTS
jgi:hypothetical protein